MRGGSTAPGRHGLRSKGVGMVIRFFVTFAMWMLLGNWVYDEVRVSFPGAIPVVDRAIDALSIPTHDQWDKEKIAHVVNAVGETVERVGKFSFPDLDEVEQLLGQSADLRVPSLEGNLKAYSAPLFDGSFDEQRAQGNISRF